MNGFGMNWNELSLSSGVLETDWFNLSKGMSKMDGDVERWIAFW